ncbi:uncharacterized protein LOC125006418 [Mugil cephalus]|uniref:uncharacterized protein LOC125006418 n=1 Tax=Mugil cephalus TaxID=48193 RepID=UPI001FB6A390|nr:uncharacterized protein LOC125006418 [Mugil cephalus]
MKVRNTWIFFFFFFFLALQDGNTGLVNGRIYTEKEGGNITVECSFTFSGGRRLFCRNKCEEGNILIDTTEVKAQRDRYSIEYIKRGVLSADTLYVSITQLKKSDSGWYRCYLRERTWSKDSSEDFEITVTEASTPPKPTLSLGPFSTSTYFPSSSTPPTPLTSTSSSFSEGPVQPASSSAGSGLILYVALTLVFMIIILSVALMIFCKWRRTTKPKACFPVSPIESVYTDVAWTDRLYEEIREDKRSSSPPEGISTVYTCAKYVKPNGAESSDDYSLNQSPQERDDGALSKLDYCEEDVSNTGTDSLYSAPRGCFDNINNTSPPLYSTLY